MKKTVGFATHGETLSFLFEAFGVLPRKEARGDGFDEKDKKTLQKQLNRLSSEQGSLVVNYENAVKVFRDLITKYLPVEGHAEALQMALDDLDSAYANLVRTQGSYLNKPDSLRYFISVWAVRTLVMAVNRNSLILWLQHPDGLLQDVPFWYLPTFSENGKMTMPLAKVMRWAYATCGVSQQQFHAPGGPNGTVLTKQENNLDNAINWMATKARLPSLPALVANFKESFAAQRNHDRPVDPKLEERVLIALVYARVATYIAREIGNAYGPAYLQEICELTQHLTLLLQEEVEEFMGEVIPIIGQKPTAEEAQRTWMNACSHHHKFIQQKLTIAGAALNDLLYVAPDPLPVQDPLNGLVKRLGNFAVQANLDYLRRNASFTAPSGFCLTSIRFSGSDN